MRVAVALLAMAAIAAVEVAAGGGSCKDKKGYGYTCRTWKRVGACKLKDWRGNTARRHCKRTCGKCPKAPNGNKDDKGCYNYKGLQNEKRIAERKYLGKRISPKLCIDKCGDKYKYVGVLNHYCHCLYDMNNAKYLASARAGGIKTPDNQCYYRCDGDKTKKCGG